MSELQTIIDDARLAFAACCQSAELENAKAKYLGKTGQITQLMKTLASLNAEEKKLRGAQINQVKQAVETALEDRRRLLNELALQVQLSKEALDVSLPGRSRAYGGLHPVMLAQERIESIFGSMGFSVADGPEVENDWFNFTALNTPENHPARSMHDTFYIKTPCDGTSKQPPLLLRTHTSPMQVRYAVQHVKSWKESPNCALHSMDDIRVIAPGKTYRVDSDATHSPMFHQCEGLWIGQSVSFKDLKVVFTDFCKAFFESDQLILRFRPSFFPFTEPSAEVDIQFTSGEHSGHWLEVAGCGQVHPNVLIHMGLNPEEYTGFAFGIGMDRFTMLRYGIQDLRMFFDSDLRFLSQFQ